MLWDEQLWRQWRRRWGRKGKVRTRKLFFRRSLIILIIQAGVTSSNNQFAFTQKNVLSLVFPFSEWPNISYDAGPNYWKTRLWIFRRWAKIHFPPFAPRNGLTLARWPLFASYLQNTKFKMKRSKICRKQIFPSCLGLKIMGTGFGRKYLKNPTLPLLQQRDERGSGGNFWVRQNSVRQTLVPTTAILFHIHNQKRKTSQECKTDITI